MKIIVAGGGAAGMMAAIAAAGQGEEALLLEQNEKLGKKLYITGKGRCNLTNAGDRADFFSHVARNPKFMHSSFSAFDNRAVMDFFTQAGCPLTVERGARVFPASGHSSDVIKALAQELKKRGVQVLLNCAVEDILPGEDGRVAGVRIRGGRVLPADRVILATGGCSYPATGSDGKMLRTLEKRGHKLISPRPALAPLVLREDWGRRLQGLALKNVSLRLIREKKTIYEGFGELLFTHFGISGPLALSASSFFAGEGEGGETACLLDLKPALSEEALERRLLREFDGKKNKRFANALDSLFPARLAPLMAQLSGIPPERRVNGITREERKRLASLIKGWKMTVTGTRGFEEAVITRGGISVKEVNPSTMESRRLPGLYLAGEMLDIDALTGGYNLQLAWSTGYLAGMSCRANKK